MSIMLLRSFVEVYRQGSVSKAAEELGLTQPAVSSHIASLETMLERKLFTRHARGVKPTLIADELAGRVSDAIDTAENVLAETRARSLTLSGTVHLCGPSDILSDLVTEKIRLLAENNLAVRLLPAAANELAETLVEGRADFGLAVLVPDDSRIESALFGSEELVLVVHPSRLAEPEGEAVLERWLNATPFLAYDLDRYLVRAWLDHNRLDIGNAEEAVTAPDLRGLRNFVKARLGWSVLPRYLVRDELDEGSLVEVVGPHGNPSVEYHLFWLKSSMRNPRAARAKSLLLRSEAAQMGLES